MTWVNGLAYKGLGGGNAWFNGLLVGPVFEPSPVFVTTGFAAGGSTATGYSGTGAWGLAQGDSSALGITEYRLVATAPAAFTFTPPDPSQATFVARRSPAVQISRRLNDTPGNASYLSPELVLAGQNVDINFQDGNGSHFQGIAQTVSVEFDAGFDINTAEPIHNVDLIDYSWLLNCRRPIACYERVSATTAVLDLIARFSSGFTTTQVEAGLPAVTVRFTGDKPFTACLATIANLIGARFKLVLKDLLFKIADDAVQPDPIDDDNTDLIHEFPITLREDISQIRNRVFARGAGVTVVSDTRPHDTYMWVSGMELFSRDDGTGLHVSLGGGEMMSDCQRFTYQWAEVVIVPVDRGDPPAGFSVGPAMFDLGQIKVPVRYKISITRSSTGESELGIEHLGPVPSSYRTTAPAFAGAPVGTPVDGGFCTGNVPTGVKRYLIGWRLGDGTIVCDNTVTNAVREIDSQGSTIFPPGSLPTIPFSATGSNPDTRAIGKVLLRTKIGNTAVYYEVIDMPLEQTGFTDIVADDALGEAQPAINYGGIAIILTGLPIDIDRQSLSIYRSDFVEGAWTPYGLLETLGDAFTNTYLDTFGDVSVGDPPAAPAPIVMTRLVGIPYSGDGSITKTIRQGETVSLYAMEEDTAAQAVIRLREGGDGIHEHEVTGTSDIITYDSLRARLRAELEVWALPIKTVRYTTTDRKSKTGCKVPFNLTRPPIGPFTLKIQTVEVDRLHEADDVIELYTVTASSALVTIDDVLRRAARAGRN